MVASKLTTQEMHELKEDLWRGADYKEVMEKYGISYQIAVGVKAGRTYNYVPWPDGSLMAMPDYRKQELSDAKKYATRTERAVHRATAAAVDNSRLSHAEQQSVDETARRLGFRNWAAYEEHLRIERMKMLDAEAKAAHEAYMAPIRARDARLEANPKLEARYWRARKSRAERAKNIPVPGQTPQDQVDPEANQKMDWESVVLLGEGVKVVQIAAAEEHEPSLRLAIQIVFKLLSPRQWKEDHTLRMIYSIKQKIENFWEANRPSYYDEPRPKWEDSKEFYDEYDPELNPGIVFPSFEKFIIENAEVDGNVIIVELPE